MDPDITPGSVVWWRGDDGVIRCGTFLALGAAGVAVIETAAGNLVAPLERVFATRAEAEGEGEADTPVLVEDSGRGP